MVHPPTALLGLLCGIGGRWLPPHSAPQLGTAHPPADRDMVLCLTEQFTTGRQGTGHGFVKEQEGASNRNPCLSTCLLLHGERAPLTPSTSV